jgi:hypothetical protein
MTADYGAGVTLSTGCGWVLLTKSYLYVGVFHNFNPADLVSVFSVPSLSYVSSYGTTLQPGSTLKLIGNATNGAQTAAATGYSLAVGANSLGITLLSENPATPTKGMVAYITAAYPGMWQVGDSKRAWLCDATAETVDGTELVTNGTFATDTSGWDAESGATLSVVLGALRVTATGGYPGCSQTFATLAGKTYTCAFTLVVKSSLKNIWCRVKEGDFSGTILSTSNLVSTDGVITSFTFVATSSVSYIIVYGSSTFVSGDTFDIDNISVRLAEPDRSVKNKPLPIYGQLTKTMVGGVAMYSGFSASNYMEEAYSSDLDFETGDFCVIVAGVFSGSGSVFHRALSGSTGGILIVNNAATGFIDVYLSASTTYALAMTSSGVTIPTTGVSIVEVGRASGVVYVRVNGAAAGSAANTTNITYTNAAVRVGLRCDGTVPCNSAITFVRISATAPSADQIAQIYRDELALFQTGASGTLAGAAVSPSSAVTAISYDATTDLTHVGTSTHRSSFKGLTRVSSEATPSGAITSISAAGGALLTGGTSGYISAPAVTVREAIEGQFKKSIEKPVVQDYSSVVAQTSFELPKGYTTLAFKVDGVAKQEGSSKYWTRTFDGYKESIVPVGGDLTAGWVQIEMVRA